MKTNELNYASLEASKRLVKAGIVLETDSIWFLGIDGRWYLSARWLCDKLLEVISAPSPAEVWRELPECIPHSEIDWIFLRLRKQGDLTICGYGEYGDMSINANLADAMIDLLIFVNGEL